MCASCASTRRVASARDYGLEQDGRARAVPHVVIYTDGACSGNPGPGGWGAILQLRRPREGIVGRRAAHHQQPHGADGGDPGAGSAEAAVPRRVCTPTANMCATASPLDPRLEAQRLAHRRQEAGQECRPVAAARRGARRSTRCAGTGCKGHAGHADERARRRAGAGGDRRASRAGSVKRWPDRP